MRIKEEISQVINAANKVNVSGVKDDANVINKKLQPKKHTRNWGQLQGEKPDDTSKDKTFKVKKHSQNKQNLAVKVAA